MKKRNPVYLIGIILGLFLICFSTPSCTATRHGTKKAVKYSRQRTKQARWNTTTSRTTTYYIKKHSTKNRKAPKKPTKHK